MFFLCFPRQVVKLVELGNLLDVLREHQSLTPLKDDSHAVKFGTVDLTLLFTVTFNLSKRDLAEVPSPSLTLMFSSLRRFFLSSVYVLLFKPRPTPNSLSALLSASRPSLTLGSMSRMLSSLQSSSNVVSSSPRSSSGGRSSPRPRGRPALCCPYFYL